MWVLELSVISHELRQLHPSRKIIGNGRKVPEQLLNRPNYLSPMILFSWLLFQRLRRTFKPHKDFLKRNKGTFSGVSWAFHPIPLSFISRTGYVDVKFSILLSPSRPCWFKSRGLASLLTLQTAAGTQFQHKVRSVGVLEPSINSVLKRSLKNCSQIYHGGKLYLLKITWPDQKLLNGPWSETVLSTNAPNSRSIHGHKSVAMWMQMWKLCHYSNETKRHKLQPKPHETNIS